MRVSDKKKNIREKFSYYIERPTVKNRQKALDEVSNLSAQELSGLVEILNAYPVASNGARRSAPGPRCWRR
jgi:hypothetical protein